MKSGREVLERSLSAITIDRTEAIRVFQDLTASVQRLVERHAPHDRPIPHLTWTVSQCLAHQAMGDWMYTYQLIGPGLQLRLEDTSKVNDWTVAPLAGLDPRTVAHELERSGAALIDVVRSSAADATFTWWSGAQASVDTAVGLLIGERLVHGWDLAQAYGEPWPIDPRHASIAMSASFAVLPLLVEPDAAEGLDATIEMRLRGGGRYALRFTDGVLTTSEATSEHRADAHVSADPVALLLVGYGRIPQFGQLIRGKILTWGRRPWVALRLGSVLRNP
jgi:hypothetical protein